MSRPIVQLHSIEQWLSVDKTVQDLVLTNIKIRERLWKWLMAREVGRSMAPLTEGWAACSDCESRGWVQLHPRRPGIHPSQMGSSCLLKIYNEMKGLQQQTAHEPRTQLIFDVGTAVHKMLQNYGREGAWGPVYRAEVDIGETETAKTLRIEGHCDGENILVIDDIPNHDAIYEIGLVHEYKTINNNGFEGLKNRPMPKHKQQANIYSACLNRPVVAFLYLNKDNCNTADFPVPFDGASWTNLAERAAVLISADDSNTPPAADIGFHCKQCGYVYNCAPYLAAKGGPK
jgi:hypothetical protein